MKRTPIDPDLLRDRLAAAQGKQYWRGVEELADDPAVEEMLQREFPDNASDFSDPLSRRRFLMLMGASLALAGAAGCRPPTGTIMPFIRQPENYVLGMPLYYATSMTLAGWGTGLLVESHEGRPTKIEGNEKHSASKGGTSPIHQAAILGMYDPDRSQTVKYRGQTRAYGDVIEALRKRLKHPDGKPGKGEGFALLTETVGSPTLHAAIQAFLAANPGAKWYQHEPAHRDNVIAGAELAFGQNLHAVPHIDKADRIVSLAANFLAEGPAHLALAREFASRRKPDAPGGMNRLYVIETDLTVTGASADNRLPMRPTRIEAFAHALAVELRVSGAQAPRLDEDESKWAREVAADLLAHKGKSLVLVGDSQPPAVHALAHAINAALENVGQTIDYIEPPLPARHRVLRKPTTEAPAAKDEIAPLPFVTFASDLAEGRISTLLIIGANPAYTSPADLGVESALKKALAERRDWLAVHVGLSFNETARLCHWHIPQSHFLESWGDAVAFDGSASVVQPLIAPLYESRSALEVVTNLTWRKKPPANGTQAPDDFDFDTREPLQIVRDYWRTKQPAGGKFDDYWQTSLHDGVLAGTAPQPVKPTTAPGLLVRKEMTFLDTAPQDKKLEIAFATEPGVFDGQFANNGWLQEWPRPITRLTWDNALLLSPKTAAEFGLSSGVGNGKGGEHGHGVGDVVTLEQGTHKLDVAIWVLPGHADGVGTLYLGYGRTHAGKVGTGAGFDAYKLRLSTNSWFLTGVAVRKRSRRHTLACVQGHTSMEGRDLVRSATLEQYQKDPKFATAHDHHLPGFVEGENGRRKPLTLYPPEHHYDGYKWGMAIDLSACTGCGACVVACQAENNSPVIGKEEVVRGREMHWLRIDRYFQTGRELHEIVHPNVYFQPVMCQHCEQAPCEIVCPVEATVHGDEGTNDMVYNRCVGTRYCANNCPYKVRRFNYFNYADFDTPTFKLMYNPDVTVRTRGVMEKCTFCIQRVSSARIQAATEAMAELELPPSEQKRRDTNGEGGGPRLHEGREIPLIRDGEVVSACQSACPSSAIVFGDLNDKTSQVRKMHDSSRRYDLLGELGTRPRVAYLASVRNPNPKLTEAQAHGH